MRRNPLVAAFGEYKHDGKVGVIDIGSNSIRLVVYDGIKRVPVPLYNEKVMCALGKELGETGRLNPDGVKLAKQCMARLLTMVRLLDVVELQIIATAAIRDASDGVKFVEDLERKHRIRIDVISGDQEAMLGGMGVLANLYAPQGLVGDLGGGSMELVLVDDGQLGQHASLPIGPLRLLDGGVGKPDYVVRVVQKALTTLDWLPAAKGQSFYAVGGSFRAIAKLHMQRCGYPLTILHNYRITAPDALALCAELIQQSVADLQQQGVPGKRAASLMPAAITLAEVITHTGVADVVFCASGIREGYLYEHLSPYVRMEDPLIASCTDVLRQERLRMGYARDVFTWTNDIFVNETISEHRLRQAACILSEMAWHIHPEYRASYAFQRTVQSAIVGLDHAERVALGIALHHRYRYKDPVASSLLALLTPRQLAWGKAVGIALHLAFQLAGGMPGNLPLSELQRAKKELHLLLADDLQDAMDESIRKRLNALGRGLAEWSALAN
jgi:exopolyphosphatase / guanosine-5'-triphosphate,3'-diphosphate pyrophosphatase